jgi:hypothetical protein
MRPVLLAALLLATACASLPDPVDRPGTWSPSGANEENLRAMVADPAHLTRGTGAPGSRSAAAERPVTRLLAGERASLPTTAIMPRAAIGPGNAAR